MDIFSTYRLLLVIALIGVPAVAIYWTWKGVKKKEVPCPCGSKVTPIGGHGPCGCCLAQPLQRQEWEERRNSTYN